MSTIKFNCNKSFSTIKKWIIKNSTINNYSETNSGELYISSNTLAYGIYQLEFTVIMSEHPNLTSSVSVYIEIRPSDVTVNLIPSGTSVITSGHQQHLILNPGYYSIDPDGYEFNTSVCLTFVVFFSF